MFRFSFFLYAVLTFASDGITAQASGRSDRLKGSIDFLTSSELAGRDAPGPNADTTARWIELKLKEFDLLPAFEGTHFLQSVPLQQANLNARRTLISISGSKEIFLSNYGEEFYIFPRLLSPTDLATDVIYCGFGLSIPNGRNDYPVEVNGKTALVKAGSDLPPAQAGMRANAAFKAAAAERAGATGLVVVYSDSIWPPPDLSAKIVAGAKPLIDLPGEKSEFPIAYIHLPGISDLDLGTYSKMNLRTTFTNPVENPSANVAAKFPGLRDEWVIVGAHYDHLGEGFQGADDNASGTSGLLELAEQWSQKSQQLRGVIFVWFTAEEDGLLGSQWFVDHLPVEREKVIAMINLDMIGRDGFASMRDAMKPDAKPDSSFAAAYFSGSSPALQNVIRAATAGSELGVLVEPVNSFRHFGDAGPFHAAKIPTMHIFSGFHADYHTTTDTPEKIDYNKLERMIDLTGRILENLIEAPDRPGFDPSIKVEGGGMGY